MLLLAVVSPIDYWADDYFFVHMIEHILIMFFAPVLIVAGAPWLPLLHGLPVGCAGAWRGVLLGGWAQAAARHRPVLTTGGWPWSLFNVVMVLWHVPASFDSPRGTRSCTSG